MESLYIFRTYPLGFWEKSCQRNERQSICVVALLIMDTGQKEGAEDVEKTMQSTVVKSAASVFT